MEIGASLGIETIERSVDRGELYAADELFFTGTAAGLAHIASVDRRIVGDGTMGPVTKMLSEVYQRAGTTKIPRGVDGSPPPTHRERR